LISCSDVHLGILDKILKKIYMYWIQAASWIIIQYLEVI
jgi:hypothetical protein